MGYIYFIDDKVGLTKIGWTRKPVNERIKQFQRTDITLKFYFETKYPPSKLETALHNRFKSYAKGREWFDLTNFTTEELKKTCKILDKGIKAILNPRSEENWI